MLGFNAASRCVKHAFFRHVAFFSSAANYRQIEVCSQLDASRFKFSFFDQYPVVVKRGLNWPALDKWSLDYFYRTLPDSPVNLFRIDTQNNYAKSPVEGIALKQAIKCIEENDSLRYRYYIIRQSIPASFPCLLDDIGFPVWHSLPSEQYDINLWVGEPGNKTLIHSDAIQNFLVQIHGEKEVILFPKNNGFVKPRSPFTGGRFNFSQVGHLDEESAVVSSMKNTPSYEAYRYVLGPGEVLYIPPGWWHQVSIESMSISVNYFWVEDTGRPGSCREAVLSYQATSLYNTDDSAEVSGEVNSCTYDNCLDVAEKLNEMGSTLLAARLCGLFVEGMLDALSRELLNQTMDSHAFNYVNLMKKLSISHNLPKLTVEECDLWEQALLSYRSNASFNKQDIADTLCSARGYFKESTPFMSASNLRSPTF
jgi:hypothetical protein